MLTILPLAILSVTFLHIPAIPASSTDVKAIREVLDLQVAAWNRADLDAFLQAYWNSDELSFFSGDQPLKGWRATLERYRRLYQGERNEMGELRFSEVTVTILGGEAALVRGRWHLRRDRLEDLGGLFTLVFRRFPQGWKIIHDHTSSGSQDFE